MFLEGTYHVLVIYIIVGLILCLPPLLLPQWKSLVRYFNEKAIWKKNLLPKLFLGLGLGIAATAMIFMVLHHKLIFNIEIFLDPVPEYIFFNFYTLFSFILLPFSLALIGCVAYIRHSSELKLGNLSLIMLGLFAMGLAGSFLHDILWCGTRTYFYTVQIDAGYDLDWWRNLLGVASKDYRMFGFYMFVLTTILVFYTFVMLLKHEGFLEKKHDRNTRENIILLSLLHIQVVGVALYVMEYWRLFTFAYAVVAIFVGIPISLYLSYYIGKKLAA